MRHHRAVDAITPDIEVLHTISKRVVIVRDRVKGCGAGRTLRVIRPHPVEIEGGIHIPRLYVNRAIEPLSLTRNQARLARLSPLDPVIIVLAIVLRFGHLRQRALHSNRS